MKKGMLTLLLQIIIAGTAFATPAKNIGPLGIDAGGFKNLSTALSSPATAGKPVIISKPMAINNKTTDRAIIVKDGGRVTVAKGRTFYANGSFEAGAYQVFDGPGAVSLGNKRAHRIWFGSGTASVNSSALSKCIASTDDIFVDSGEYSPIVVAAGNKVFTMDDKVIFKLPDGQVTATDTSGPAALKISGNNVRVNGNFSCDGNSANQNISAFTTSNRDGILRITGNGITINGRVLLIDPYFVGLQVDGGNRSGGEVRDFYLDHIKIVNSYQRSAMIYSVNGFTINTIIVESGANSVDSRVRFGTGDSATALCINGKVGLIQTDWTIVFEQKSRNIYVKKIQAVAGKIEGLGTHTDHDSYGITIDQIEISGSHKGEYYGWGFNGCKDIKVGSLSVKGYNPAIAPHNPVFINKLKDSWIGSIYVEGTVPNVPDLRITGFDNLRIDSITSIAPVGTGNGVWLDHDVSFAPQVGLDIGSINTSGHSNFDFVKDSGFTPANKIRIGKIDSSAKRNDTRNRK